jgi:hypothetical protein
MNMVPNVDMMVPNAVGGGGGTLTINTTPIAGATGKILWDNTGMLQEVTVGSGLSFSGGTLSATSAPITINTTPIVGGTSGHVLYDNAGTVGEAANFTISSGNPNVVTGHAYLFNGVNALYSVPNITADNWFEGGSGNLTLTGNSNYGTGTGALSALTTASGNVAVGPNALLNCTTGDGNVAIGTVALVLNESSPQNIAIGNNAAHNLTSGNGANICVGGGAGQNLNTGSFNIFLGQGAGSHIINGIGNIAIGGDFSADGNSQLNILNLIYGNVQAVPNWVSIGNSTQYRSAAFSVNGTICTNSATFLIQTNTSYSDGAGTGSGVTFTNAPGASGATGNPTKWIPIDDNNTTRYVPAF